MRIGFIGDIIGKPARQIIQARLQEIKQAHSLDFVIGNGENASHGFGLSISSAQELFASGIHVLTGGNHTWDKREIMELLKGDSRVLRPHNYPKTLPGSGIGLYECCSHTLAVINLMGHFGMPHVDNAFRMAEEIISHLHSQDIRHIIVDFHAEATSEKRSLACILNGKVSAVIGTHTHIGTDDLEVLNGTLSVSDVGACGCMDGVIGMDKTAPCERFLTGLPLRFEIPSQCRKILPMIILELDSKGKCTVAYKLRTIDSAPPQRLFDAYFYK
ncbi:metallophosphoesterase [Helicobacter monodelphidis]|uniref:TIGR00282 family metallophosphoesterase n=1 Tax=Helicobacter sp. 15-1451 TaxID=2004995 RepID=UPI000DCE1AA7|nr:TIGR00282 family metallophosphoesterase [Helicobacter sp. 15-1451]RAX57912.1 metallophosphoesterase [Helicobacter sp. 15-1451]